VLGLEADGLDVEQPIPDRYGEHTAADHGRAALVPESELAREEAVLVDLARAVLPGTGAAIVGSRTQRMVLP
jgi:hypothetical protein